MCRVAVCLIAALLGATTVLSAAANGQDPPLSGLGAGIGEPGLVDLGYFGDPGSKVYLDERLGSRTHRLGVLQVPAKRFVALYGATVWRCDRLLRFFESTEVKQDGERAHGSFDVRTPSCAKRFRVEARSRAKLDALVRVRIVDRWNIGGLVTRLCVTSPRGKRACRPVPFDPAVNVMSRNFRATSKGLWKIELRVTKNHRVRAGVSVGSRAPRIKLPPIVLATGDSTMQGIDNFLDDRLGEKARVRHDVHVGTGITSGTGWLTRAAKQATRFKPKITVISIGAGDGNPMQTPAGTTVTCCDAMWQHEYNRRVTLMMKRYRRGGKGKVLWLTIPLPRTALHASIIQKINGGIMTAAAGSPGVKILRLDTLFTPHGYRDLMRFRGRDVQVRAVDGVHLSAAGTSIAAEAVQKALRKGW